jgi:hypothetical protein
LGRSCEKKRCCTKLERTQRRSIYQISNPSNKLEVPVATVAKRTVTSSKARTAFISGHIDITPAQFTEAYASALDTAIHRGDAFVLSNAESVDTLALAYLRTHEAHASRITVYMHTTRHNRKVNATGARTNKMRMGSELDMRYRMEGYNCKVMEGYYDESDAAMSEASDYDILMVRGEAETAALYGDKYQPGRVSGTQKNEDRRLIKDKRPGARALHRAREL